MTSQESIGSCSLDVDRSASDRSEATVDSISERTLHSLNLSNGDTASPTDNPVNGSNETISKTKEKTPEKDNLNGEIETEQLTAKKPSYLGLACSISGYSGITRYDSKLREGFRSRDSSPGSRLITRETSPAGFRSSENLGIPAKSQSISPLAMDRQNGFSNGNKECRVATFVETRSSLGTCQGYSEVDRGLPIHSFTDISPIRGSPKRMTQITTCRETKTFTSTITVSSPKTSNTSNLPSNCLNESNLTNGSAIETDNQALNSSCEKSFIQQRVERLYGPGALAQGFFFKRSLNQSTSSESSFNKSSNNNDSLIDNANTEESLKNLPVLRHLRPEFRAQLPVVSPRRATDGSEQVKPLQRISPVVGKNDGKTTVSPPSIKISDHEAFKLSSSVTSIPDQQPAALEVVLPVLEPSVSATSVPEALKSMQESQTEEKDGHYFMKLLKAEIDRLFKLAVSAEEVLESGEQLPEEAAGKLRSAAGKARLLATQKMQQFEGLCHKNINQIPGEEFPTTNEDLAGFWDMVMLQVVQVNDLFEHIDKLKRSQWQEIPPEKSAATQGQNGVSAKRRTVVSQKPKSAANSEANRKAREAREIARRQMMEERRKAMKSQIQQSVEIFAPKT
uniref:Dlgap1 protein n=1 Tax=Fopius arisanus TaxID=64838 RepID=A0A0C9RNZ4_9HYME